MAVLWKKEIDKVIDSGYLNNNISITDALIENFYKEVMKPEDRKLLELFFTPNPTQEELNNLLKIWDIEVKGGAKALMLAYFMKQHPNLKFSDYEGPRLKGLLKYFRFHNLKIISHYSKIGRALNENGITPMILKGGAMKYLRPDLPRVMGDIDALVKDEEFAKAVKIVLDTGEYEYDKMYDHSVDFHEIGQEAGALDLHKYIEMDSKMGPKLAKLLYKRARKANIFGVQSLIPSNEDLLFITLINLARNLKENTSKAGLLYALFDCDFLMNSKPDFDWNIVISNAKAINMEIQMNFALKFINKISPNILPKNIQNNIIFEEETSNYSIEIMYDRFYLNDLRTKCRPMKVSDLLKNPSEISEYLKLKPAYFTLKLLRGHPHLIKLLIKDLKERDYGITCLN